MNHYNPYFLLFKRDLLLLAFKHKIWFEPSLYFLGILLLFPLAIGPVPQQLAALAPALIWVALCMTLLPAIARAFDADYRQGFLQVLLLSPHHLPTLIGMKLLAQIIVLGSALATCGALAAALTLQSNYGMMISILSLVLVIPTMCCIGLLGVALTQGIAQGGLLLGLLVLPLYMPVLILVTQTCHLANQNIEVSGQLALLLAILIVSLLLSPVLIARILKVMLSI